MNWMRFLRRGREDDEVRRELDSYIEEETSENLARGMTAEEARRQARIKLGNPEQVRERLWRQSQQPRPSHRS